MAHLRQRMESGEAQCFRQDAEGVLWFKDCLVVLKDFELHRKIMDETHCSWYSIHLGTNKMYQDLKKNFWWTRMKREMAKYVLECDTCRRIKADHLRPAGNLQPLSIPEWKWENICIDFIVGLPRTSRGYHSIWVVVDRLTKSAHFIPVATTYRVGQYVKLYISHVVCYHGIPKTIIFSFPLCRADDRAAQARPRPLVLPSPLLSNSSSRAPEPPHRSPHPDHRLRPPAAHSPKWIPAEHRHHPPLPGELLPELPIPAISCNFLTPCLFGAAEPHTRRLRRLTIDPPFRCAPALFSLPGTFPVTPSRSPATPCHRQATAEPPASTPPRRPMHGLRVVTAPVRARSRPRRPVAPLGWAGLTGRGLAGISADRACQAAASRGL
jgi:hypothetical protein